MDVLQIVLSSAPAVSANVFFVFAKGCIQVMPRGNLEKYDETISFSRLCERSEAISKWYVIKYYFLSPAEIAVSYFPRLSRSLRSLAKTENTRKDGRGIEFLFRHC